MNPKQGINQADSVKRRRQEDKLVRVLRVHKITHRKLPLSKADAQEIATKLGVCTRTLYRDLAALKKLYDVLGTTKLD